MPTRIAGYYDELQRREGLNPIELITNWAQDDADVLQRLFVMRLLHPECTLCPPLWRDLAHAPDFKFEPARRANF